jgi:predicted CxxxxCH...CXXCH cytochrome family protein
MGIAVVLASGCGGEAPEMDAPAAIRSRSEVSTAATAMDPHTLHRTLAATQCADCHSSHGGMMGTALISFGPRAILPGQPAPSFSPTAKTCSNVACHMVPAGTYTFWFPGGDGEPMEFIVSYGGVPVTTPSWGSALSGACRACHASPPSPSSGAWHSGFHGGTASAALNACSLCHPNVVVLNGELAISTAMNCGPMRNQSCAALHRNGVVDMSPKFKSSCFGCH